MQVDPVLASIHALPARFRQRLAARLGGVAFAVQAGEWCCLGITPALLARNPHAWQSLMLLVAAFFGMVGGSATLTTLSPPRSLRLHVLLTGCALAAASAFLLVLHPQFPLMVVAIMLGGASLGGVQVQSATLRAWLTDTPSPQITNLWSWLAAIAGCWLAGLLTSLTVWTLPLWLTAWTILVTCGLVLRVPQPPLTPPPAPSSWRATIAQFFQEVRQIAPLRRADAMHLSSQILWLVLPVAIPASAILTHHVATGVAIAWLALTQLALVAGMGCSGIVHPLAQRWPALTTPHGLGGILGVLALVGMSGLITGHLLVALLTAFMVGLVRARATTLAPPHPLVAPLTYLAVALLIGLSAIVIPPSAAHVAHDALRGGSISGIPTLAHGLGEGGCR